ncbi:MAG: oxygen-independent coproporphyrinogen oxidase [Gemmatimonadetes bacterium]|nr:oxygen-independent coproporphyrinogen oxidase [Gemmatimonadota bacterium]
MNPRHAYIHVPFCARRCTYCDFAIAVRGVVPVDEYVSHLARELDRRFPRRDAWPVDTIYLGGGTPSRLGGEGVARALDVLRARMQPAEGVEVTIEANPEDVSPESVAQWREAGVNRISLGAQSFDDRVLTWMHRVHDAQATRDAVRTLRDGGITNLSLDLIFSLPEALERDWSRDLDEALALEPDHLSLYGLTVEPHTPLGRRTARGDDVESPEERYESEFLLAHERVTGAGLDHYEVSNFGRPGRRSRHNSSYWANVAYAGLGPAAHEFDGSVRRWNVGPYAHWLRALDSGADPMEGSEELTPDNRIAEGVYLGLRTSDGLALTDSEGADAASWVSAGWGTLDAGNVLRLTASGWLRLDSIAARLTVLRSR